MSLYKRGSTWWINVTTPSGERIRRSAETSNKAQAQELHDRLKAENWRVESMGELPKWTWDDAGYRWLKEMDHKRTLHDDVLKLRWIQPFFRGRVLGEITRDDITALGERKMREASKPTANRYLALIRAILRKACFEWGWIDKMPKVKMYREARRRVRWITPEQARALLGELPEHQRDVTVFALTTGLRQANVTGLTWATVDLARQTAWVPDEDAKGGEDINVSLSDLALEVLARQVGKHAERVFTYKGRPVRYVNTKAWRNALKRAGIENFRWHDLRHTWASWLVQNGTPLYDLQEMGGWKSAEMVRRYAHLAPAQMAKHAAVIGEILRVTNPSQAPKTGVETDVKKGATITRNSLI